MATSQEPEPTRAELSHPEVITPEFWAEPYTRCRPLVMVAVTYGDLSLNIGLPYVGPFGNKKCTVSWPSYSGSRCRELLPRMVALLDMADRTMATIDSLFESNKERLEREESEATTKRVATGRRARGEDKAQRPAKRAAKDDTTELQESIASGER